MASSLTSSPALAESSEAFEQRITNTVTSGFMAPCIALGSKLGLFDKMAEFTQPITSHELADAMDYKERYVREWLKSMACLRVVDYDVAANTYFFPEGHHSLLTRNGGSKNLSLFTECLPILVHEFPLLVECFRSDGPRGISADKFIGLSEWQGVQSQGQLTEQFFRDVFASEPELKNQLERGIKVCDLGCGTGIITQRLAKVFPNSSFHGCDVSAGAIQRAKKLLSSAAGRSNSNLSFSVQDACDLPAEWSDSFDLVLGIYVLHDLPFASRALLEINRAIKPGGSFYMMDVQAMTIPSENNPILYPCSLFYCLPQSLKHEGSEALTAWEKGKGKEMLTAAGFSSIRELPNPNVYHMTLVCNK